VGLEVDGCQGAAGLEVDPERPAGKRVLVGRRVDEQVVVQGSLTAHPTGLKATLAIVPVVPSPKTPPPAAMSPVTNGALAWKVSSIVIVTG
jgi:hypothetical protein